MILKLSEMPHTLSWNGTAWGNQACKGATPTRSSRSMLATVVRMSCPRTVVPRSRWLLSTIMQASPQAHNRTMVSRQAGESALHQFDADAVRGCDITQQATPNYFLQGHGKAHPFGAQFVTEGAQVAVIAEAEVISPPSIVAGVIGVRLDLAGSRGGLAGPLAPDD